MKKENITSGSIQTKKLGERFAKEVLKKKPALTRRGRPKKTAFVIGLEGELGGGKTTFMQGFAKGLGVKEKILSPTFVIMKKFKIQYLKSNIQYLIHIDCYRIEKPKELLTLGFKEIISNPKNIIAVEWADRIRKIMPKDSIWIKFDFIDRNTRRMIYKISAAVDKG